VPHDNQNGKPFRYAWVFPLCLSLVGLIFGAGGATVVTRCDVARHETAIKELTVRANENEKTLARIDERLARIEQDMREIKGWIKSL